MFRLVLFNYYNSFFFVVANFHTGSKRNTMLHTIENTKTAITLKLSLLAWSKCPLLWHPPHRGYREFSQQSNEIIGDQIRWLEFEIMRGKVSALGGAQCHEIV